MFPPGLPEFPVGSIEKHAGIQTGCAKLSVGVTECEKVCVHGAL